MRRCLEKAWVGVLLLAAAGCTVDSFLSKQIVVFGPKAIVPGTVSEVSAKLQDGLSGAGLLLRTNRMNGDYRIASQANSGVVFCLHLKQISDQEGVRTRVRMEWDRGGDPELWQLVLKILNAPSDDDGASASSQRQPPGSP